MTDSRKLKENLRQGCYRELLTDLYVEELLLPYQTGRYLNAIERFEVLYGGKEVEIYSAPGRTEIGGNHTDHQNGKVLAAAVNLDAIAVVSRREDDRICIKSEGYEKMMISLDALEPKEEDRGSSREMVKGILAKLRENGYAIGGFDAYITSDVLSGSGVSSSASFEILIGSIVSGLYHGGELDPVFLAQVGRFAENVYCGKPSGLLDQMTAAVGGMIFIDFADSQKPEVRRLFVDFAKYGHTLCIVNTGGSHADLTPDYAAVPGEIKKIAAYFGEEVLRAVDREMFFEKIPLLRKQFGDRAVLRAIHVYEENDRVDCEMKALENDNFEMFRQTVAASGKSSAQYLQNVYAAHAVEEQGVTLGLALSDVILKNRGASRVHGGGFAGTIQAFVPDELVAEYKEKMSAVFGEKSCYSLKIRPYGGLKVMG